MEPFAVHDKRRSPSPWITAGILAALFFVWKLDVVPKIKSVATGTLPGDSSEKLLHQADTADSSHDDDWDAIVDLGANSSEAPTDLLSDPTLTPMDVDSSRPLAEPGNTNSVVVADYSQLPPASADADSNIAPGHDSERNSEDSTATGVLQASLEIGVAEGTAESDPPVVISAALAEKLRQIDQLYRDERILDAHAELSRLYWNQPSSRKIIRARIEHTAGLIYGTSDKQFSEPYVVEYGDTLEGIAAKYSLTWQYLGSINRTTPETLQAGQQLKVIEGPFSAVVDLDEFSMTVHAHGWYVHRYQIGIGKENRTPVGEFTVQEKLENPVWYNPDGGVVEADDPENPLGEYWLGLGNHIGIHGTIDVDSIGQAASRGCIHLGDSDIAEVYNLLGTGSKVLIRN